MTEELDYREKMHRASGILTGMKISFMNAVIFRDDPEVWFQFYLGLYLDKPTAVLIQTKDATPAIKRRLLEQPDVELFMVKDFTEKSLRQFGDYIKERVDKGNK